MRYGCGFQPKSQATKNTCGSTCLPGITEDVPQRSNSSVVNALTAGQQKLYNLTTQMLKVRPLI